MEIKQGERYLIVTNDYGENVRLNEIVIVELHDQFAKTQDVDTSKTEWRYITDLETDIVANLPPLPGQHVRFAQQQPSKPTIPFTRRPDPNTKWEDTEVGALLEKAKGVQGNRLMYFFHYCQGKRRGFLPNRLENYEMLNFAFDGTIESYQANHHRLSEIHGIGPKVIASYDAVVFGSTFGN